MTRYNKTMSEALSEVRSVTPEQIAEASARRDAMRHGAGGRRGIDPADRDDVKATDKDQELAKKNMIMQLRRSKDTKGNISIEFKDGKKQKVDPKFVELLLKAHDMIQKPRDKEQFVGMISKSYRDMLKTAKMVSKQLRMGEEVILEVKEEYVCEDCGCEQGNADPNCDCPNDSTDLQASYWVKKEEIEIDEMKMDDPKLNKIFDKLKKGQTIKLKTSSTISKGKDFVDYIVKSKNTVNKGRVEKVTLVTKGNEKSVKKFLYKRDGKVTFAIGDMGASIDDIKEDFTPHMMYDPKTGKGYKAEKEADHLRMKDMGYTHEKPEMDEAKSSTGYELYHKDFSSAMKHAYDFAKKKFGIEVDPKEIDDKVATGPKKPSNGKTNSYSLKAKGGKKGIQVQVYNTGKNYELNMYKEEVISEEEEPQKSDGAKAVEQGREDKKKTRIAQLQLQIAKAQETINQLNAQEK
ncbi:hypothetical protein MelnitzEXVC044M_20 [Methylophilales phage Melnitz EXVC044M]|nr:hypothetical protein Melnitz1EXVC043M_19 [Methylophilales phage Melnitz-1 EXVC043M]QZI94531.1 hypothetical protein Melnitz2EXVC040M_20 [Methylophilales phage Melnitz-2 EXVC040M]QZI94753.1 hypothetical protein MelnitzEXVC044M_20 [Methylophilales phage Melnitz EXVC044M]QZI94974.1 hypothetical protein Melnitz3EXVC039M_20 [Methylophilales phage Melnitz-3 EXVC039M]